MTVENQPQRMLRLKTCGRQERQFLTLLRGLLAGSGWRSQSIHELGGLGISAEASFPLVCLMESIRQLAPQFHLLSPRAPLVTLDELNLMTVLRRAAARAAPEQSGDLGFSMPSGLTELIALCGNVVRHSQVKLGSRPLFATTSNLEVDMDMQSKKQMMDCRAMRPATVVSNEELTYSMRRIRVAGTALAGLSDNPPAKWVKVFPRFDESAAGDAADGNPVGRVYTIREFDPASSTLTIDVAIHGGGAVSSWLERCAPGDSCDIAGDRGGFTGFSADIECVAFVGDETSLPAIDAILVHVPAHISVRAFIEVKDERTAIEPSGGAGSIRWFGHSALGESLQNDVAAWCSRHRNAFVWAAGEATRMRLLRRALLSSPDLEPGRVLTVGYWKEGATDHRDAAAG